MAPHRYIRYGTQVLFGLLLVCWPALDTGPAGAVTPLRVALGGLLLLLSAVALPTAALGRSPLRWHPTDRAVLACALWYAGCVAFVGQGRTDPYCLLSGLTLFASYACCRLVGTAFLLPTLSVSGLVQCGAVFSQLAGTTASRHAYYQLTGSFPNPGPLGGWLCLSLLAAVLLAMRLWKTRRRSWAVLSAAAGVCIGGGLLLSDSRAAWLGFAAGVFCLVALSDFRYKRIVLAALAGIGLAGTVWLYGYKKDSADGRLLVWRVSADLVAQKPVAGHGVGMFPERYMFAQADYFDRHPDSRFTAVAEQTGYPFNEWIGTVCEQGIVGGLLALVVVGTAFYRRGTTEQRDGRVLLTGTIVFGMFSYPSAFLAFGLLLGAALARCANDRGGERRFVSGRTAGAVGCAALVGGAYLLAAIYRTGKTDRNRYTLLREAWETMRRGEETDLPRLERWAERLPIAEFYVDLGDLYLENGRTAAAVSCYARASRMIPSRLRPYEGLWRACLRAGEMDSAAAVARRIVSMPVKVGNTTTIRIRRQAEEWLKTYE